MSSIDSLNLYHKIKTKTTKIHGNASCKEYVWFTPNSANHRKEHPKYQASSSSTTEESLCTYCLPSDQKSSKQRCPVNPVQDKTRGQTSLKSAPFLTSLNTPLWDCTVLYRVWPLMKNKPWRKSNLHFAPSSPCFISSLTYKQLTS